MRSARDTLIKMLNESATYSFSALERAIKQAQREAIEEAAKVADPPLMHRKGAPGLWRQRRAAIAAAIRSLGDRL